MKATDFLTILGLALAAWSIIPRKERKFILLFFSQIEIIAFILMLVFIHWLFAFKWILENWWAGLIIFTHPKGIPASGWAYIMIILVIGYPVTKVLTGFFPKSRKTQVLRLYNELLDQGEIQILADYIIKYHIKDIQQYLIKLSAIPSDNPRDIVMRRRTENVKKREKLSKPRHMSYAVSVYHGIVKREDFIKQASLSYPEIFVSAIKGMESIKVSDRDFVNNFLYTLIEIKSPQLVEELKLMSNSYDSLSERLKYLDLPILGAVFNNLPVAAENYIWFPFGEKGIHDLEYNDETKVFLAQSFDDSIKDQLWNYRIYISIVYFNYMVREAIYREVQWHMWLFYFDRFSRGLIDNIPVDNAYDDAEWPSFNHYLIYEIFHDMTDWLELAVEQNTTRRIIDTLRCMGRVLKQIAESDTRKISPRFKRNIFNSAIHIFFADMHIEGGEPSGLIRDRLEMILKNPERDYHGQVNVSQDFREALLDAWEHFDKVPYEGQVQELLDRFQNNVINELI